MPNLLGNTPMVSDKTIMTDCDAGFAIFHRKDRFLILGVGDRSSQFSGCYIDV
jgi:hypothetical protein